MQAWKGGVTKTVAGSYAQGLRDYTMRQDSFFTLLAGGCVQNHRLYKRQNIPLTAPARSTGLVACHKIALIPKELQSSIYKHLTAHCSKTQTSTAINAFALTWQVALRNKSVRPSNTFLHREVYSALNERPRNCTWCLWLSVSLINGNWPHRAIFAQQNHNVWNEVPQTRCKRVDWFPTGFVTILFALG